MSVNGQMASIGLNYDRGIIMKKAFKKLTLIAVFLGLFLLSSQQSLFAVKAATVTGCDEKPLTEQQNQEMANNTDRGFRLELNLNVKTGKGLWANADKTGIAQMQNAVATFAADNPRLAQVYFYLTDYKNKPLDQTAFDNMDQYFQKLKQYHLQAVLRFAYIWDDAQPKSQEPTTEQVVAHIKQLAPWIAQHRDQIANLQAGFIGAWGEWDSGARSRMNEKEILQALLANTPKDLFIQVRYYNIKSRNIDPQSSDWQRVGFHDDYLIGRPHVWNTAGADPNSAEWQAMAEQSQTVPVDGEMIWGSANASDNNGQLISAPLIAQRLAVHHFTSLSIAHNYKEDGKDYSLSAWKRQLVTPALLDQYKLPYQKSWFKDTNDNEASRSWYEYIRDYLGYRLAVKDISYQVNEQNIDYQVNLTNYGLAAPVLINKVELVLLNAAKNVVATKDVTDIAHLQSLQTLPIKWQVDKALVSQAKYLAFKFTGYSNTGNRLANNINFADGYNYLLTLN